MNKTKQSEYQRKQIVHHSMLIHILIIYYSGIFGYNFILYVKDLVTFDNMSLNQIQTLRKFFLPY